MGTKLQELERRLAAVEAELARLREVAIPLPVNATPAERGAWRERQAAATQASLDAAMKDFFAKMGVEGEPPGMEKLRAMAEQERRAAARRSKRKRATGGRAARHDRRRTKDE
jgi:hypothetical protein